MGFSGSDLSIFKDVLKDAELKERAQIDVLSLGYADVVVSDAAYYKYFRRVDWKSILKDRPNREALLKIHNGDPTAISVVPTLESFFKLYGNVNLDVMDYAQYEGSEIVQDLGEPVPAMLHSKYDVVIDGGTTEHVFDIARALMNCARMVRPGGFIYHAVPLNMLNHGFFNLSPTLLFDFYLDNGFEVLKCVGVGKGIVDVPAFFDLPPTKRFKIDDEATMHFLARKLEERDTFVKPVQRKYRNIDLWR